MAAATWKEKLAGDMPPLWAEQIDEFETQIILRRAGKIDEKVFAETRLRRGSYGQRYDNGQRHDGIKQQTIPYSGLTKGPETFFDAPGMQRIKIPFGGMTPEQMMVLAELAEEYSDQILHITTRQDIQLHFIHIADAPDLFRRLAAVGITTREACGNSVRNVTACPLAGVCNTESFDVTPYAKAVAFYLLGHRDTQDFGRKFKIAFSGCRDEACALVSIHDLGGIATIKDGKRGFELYVGGGLGAVPHQAKLMMEFCPEEELLPMARAIGRVFARLGEKKNRNRARLKFVVAKLGIEEFTHIVMEERATMPDDPSWRTFFDEIPRYDERPGEKFVQLTTQKKPDGFERWEQTNVYQQRQAGYAVVTVTCPLGDLTSDQMRALAEMSKRYAGGNVRTTVEQNLVFRWVPQNKVIDLYQELKAIGLAEPGAGSIVDVTACPGTDTCKLGIASSRGLAGELRTRLGGKAVTLDKAVQGLRIKISGCFNSCGQHHVADIGFYGNSRNLAGYAVPHFQVMLGGQWSQNGGSYALALGAIPSKRAPELVNTLTDRFVKERASADESFQAWCQRVGKKELKSIVDQFDAKNAPVPGPNVDPSFYMDWGDARQYITDVATGECAGEVVTMADFGFTAAETEAFEAQLLLDEGKFQEADNRAYEAMLRAAHTLVRLEHPDASAEPKHVVEEFKKRFVDTKVFWHRQHANQFSNYLVNRHENGPDPRFTRDTASKLVEEANLFIDAAHQAHAAWQQKMNVLKEPPPPAAAMVTA